MGEVSIMLTDLDLSSFSKGIKVPLQAQKESQMMISFMDRILKGRPSLKSFFMTN